MAKSVSIKQLLDAHHAAQMENSHVCLPCKVLSYDAATQTVSAQPLVKRPRHNEDGDTSYEEIPAYPSVQVAFPRAGAWVVYMPIVAGDFGHLIFNDVATGEARSSGQVSEPQDTARHDSGYCIFLPGGYPDPKALADHPAGEGYWGVDGDDAQVVAKPGELRLGKTATDHVVLASALQSALLTAVSGAGVDPQGAILSAGFAAQIGGATFLNAIKSALVKSL